MENKINSDNHEVSINIYNQSILMRFNESVMCIAGNERFYFKIIRSLLQKISMMYLRRKKDPEVLRTHMKEFLKISMSDMELIISQKENN